VYDHRGQKCTNILAAMSRLTPADRFVVMLDADICPQPWWLTALVGPLAAGRAEVVNGYRWMVPQPPHLAALMIADIDHRLAVFPRFASAGALWGGSLAMTREALEMVDLPSAFERQIVEDMPIADRIAETGLRLLTRRAVRVPTPLRGGWFDMWAFGRRQSQFVRIYRPRLWLIAGVMASADLLARVILVWDLFAARAMAALAILACAAALGSATAELRFAIGRRIGAADGLATRVRLHLLIWATLPIGAFYVGLIWAGAVASPIRWAHVRYALDRSGRVYATRRYPYERGREG
jgi:Glycosyl transferase family 21